MTAQELVQKYRITPNGVAMIKIPGGEKLPASVVAEIRAAKPEILAFFAAENAAQEKARADRKAKIAAIPGLTELETAISARNAHHAAFNAMMADENNDGACPPKPLTGKTVAELAGQYPVASLWLRAEGYQNSTNVDKFVAGERAADLILAGEIEKARATLENWLPESKMWD